MSAVDPKISRIAELNGLCFEWNLPERVLQIADELSDLLGDSAMLRPGRTFREAYIAGRFARRRGASSVRLLVEDGTKQTPDFELLIEGGCLRFETTEADIPGRKRGDEYKKPAETKPMTFTSLDVMVEQMRRLSETKAAKRYDDCHGLIIWVNPPAFVFNPKMRWEALVRGGEPAAGSFKEVWVMRGEGSLIWQYGIPQPEIPGEEF